MTRAPRLHSAALAAVLAFALLGAGCIKMQLHWQLYPDGSGKVKMRAIVKPPPGMGQGAQSPEELEKSLRKSSPFKDYAGLVIKPGTAKSEAKDGMLRFYAEGYFTDANQVTRKGKPVLKFSKLDSGGYEARYVGGDEDRKKLGGFGARKLPGSDDPGGEEPATGESKGDGKTEGAKNPAQDMGKAMEAMMKSMIKGFEVKLFLELPADLTETNVDRKNERTAMLVVDDKVLDDPAAQQRLESLDGVRARCGDPTPDQLTEFAAFKKELAEALAAAKAAEGKKEESGGEFPEEEK